MTLFIVNGQEKELVYNFGGIDISRDFIGNTYHGMTTDENGHYIATEQDFEWWQEVITAHQNNDKLIEAYKYRFGNDEVSQVAEDWASGDYETDPAQIQMGLEQAFGKLS